LLKLVKPDARLSEAKMKTGVFLLNFLLAPNAKRKWKRGKKETLVKK
jgi:hypothetical protein